MGKVWIDADSWVSGKGTAMGRKKRTRMIIKDVKVSEGKCIISVEIRRGPHTWNKAYGFSAEYLKTWDFEAFKKRINEDAVKLEEDKNFEERVLMRIEDMKNQTILLD
jgi:hypothetical protein